MRSWAVPVGIICFLFVAVLSGMLFFRHGDSFKRNPAAIPRKKVFDFSHLEGGALDVAIRKQILNNTESIEKDGRVGFRFGHFLVKGHGGDSTSACDVYDRVTLHFEAEGLATNGKRPQLSVSGKCSPSENLAFIKTIWLPVAKLRESLPKESEYSFEEEGSVHVSLQNADFSWPGYWVMTGITLSHQTENRVPFEISRKDIVQASSDPIFMDWDSKTLSK